MCRCSARLWITLEEVAPSTAGTYLKSLKTWSLITDAIAWNSCEHRLIDQLQKYLAEEYADTGTAP